MWLWCVGVTHCRLMCSGQWTEIMLFFKNTSSASGLLYNILYYTVITLWHMALFVNEAYQFLHRSSSPPEWGWCREHHSKLEPADRGMLSSVQTTDKCWSVLGQWIVSVFGYRDIHTLRVNNPLNTPPVSALLGCWDFPFCHFQCPDANGRSFQGGWITCPRAVLHSSVLDFLSLLRPSLSVQSYTCKQNHTRTQTQDNELVKENVQLQFAVSMCN